MTQDELHAEYEAASRARDDAIKVFHDAQRALWDAEDKWTLAEGRVQRAFTALANIGTPTT